MAADSECDLHNTFERGACGAAESGLGQPGHLLNDGRLAVVLCDFRMPVACRHRAGPPGAP
jgi:hypothetical protein